MFFDFSPVSDARHARRTQKSNGKSVAFFGDKGLLSQTLLSKHPLYSIPKIISRINRAHF
ncbi:hypothetical protein E3V59_08750 [Streptococcus pseudopneumoniae]|nr:hypothetical protein E3V59_08750 [Streptococcus pseudopneumoniae]